MNKQKGISQILVMVVMLVLAIALPVTTRLVQQSQENRSSAAGSYDMWYYNQDRMCIKTSSQYSTVSACNAELAACQNDSTKSTWACYHNKGQCYVDSSCSSTVIPSGSDSACTNKGGACQMNATSGGSCTVNGKSGTYNSGLCLSNSSSSYLCCVPNPITSTCSSSNCSACGNNCSSTPGCKLVGNSQGGACVADTTTTTCSSQGGSCKTVLECGAAGGSTISNTDCNGMFASAVCCKASTTTTTCVSKYGSNSTCVSGSYCPDASEQGHADNCGSGLICCPSTAVLKTCSSQGGSCKTVSECGAVGGSTVSNTDCDGMFASAVCCKTPTNPLVKPAITAASANVSGTSVTVTASGNNVDHMALFNSAGNWIANMTCSGTTTKICNNTVANETVGTHTYTIKACSVGGDTCPNGGLTSANVSATINSTITATPTPRATATPTPKVVIKPTVTSATITSGSSGMGTVEIRGSNLDHAAVYGSNRNLLYINKIDCNGTFCTAPIDLINQNSSSYEAKVCSIDNGDSCPEANTLWYPITINGTCTAGQVKCTNSLAQFCNSSGLWGNATSNVCGGGKICVGSECLDECTPTRQKCTSGNRYFVCESNSVWSKTPIACATGKTCVDGNSGPDICEGSICTNGTKECVGTNQARTCTGGKWVDNFCNSSQVCTNGECKTKSSSDSYLNIKMAFVGVTPGNDQCVSNLWSVGLSGMVSGGVSELTKGVPVKTSAVNSRGEIIYTYSVVFPNIPDAGISGLALFLKGPKHISIKYGTNNQKDWYSSLAGGLTLAPKTNVDYDFSEFPLIAGDVTGQTVGVPDGKIDGRDWSFIKEKSRPITVGTKGADLVGDVDGNCQVNAADAGLVKKALTQINGQTY